MLKMSLNIHKVLYLYKTPSKFYIQPVEEAQEALIIDRQTCEVSSNNMFSVSLLPFNATSSLIYGIIGIKHLINSTHLIVITKATQIGFIDGQAIYRMDQAQMIPFNHQDVIAEGKDGEQVDWNNIYVSMMDQMLRQPGYYFSYSYDLTNNFQKRCNIENGQAKEFRGHINYDRRFLWNRHLMSDFDRCGNIADRYRLPFILGFVSINFVKLSFDMTWTLISRRGVMRAGTRFNRRGIDHDGNVSNFVETEQIIEDSAGKIKISFVQVRGSIPLLWSQDTNYLYHPMIRVDPNDDHDLPMKKHFDDLRNHYSNISAINLIDNRGREGNLAHEFGKHMNYLQKYYYIPYHYFDFHKECSKMRWHRLNILIDRIHQEIETYGYFAICEGKVKSLQSGVFRTNCVDSLDRTNVVQSMIAQCMLELSSERFNLIRSGTRLTDYASFMEVFKNTWADNADNLSIQYAGTPALKTDFTRCGQRTTTGMLKDVLNSASRYVYNNFCDLYRQDAIDLFLGNYEGYPSPLHRPLNISLYSAFPVTLVVITLVILYIYTRY